MGLKTKKKLRTKAAKRKAWSDFADDLAEKKATSAESGGARRTPSINSPQVDG
jgi:hypothetical protein